MEQEQARTELGDLKVQGMDYLYTIHGWIKGINSNSLDVDRDPGRDGKDTVGNANRLVGADALSYSLHYYGGDYAPINGTSSYNATYHVSGYGGSLVDLWNGNIAGMVTTLQDIQTHAAQPQGAQYRYDQLNRIKEMQVWQDMDVINNQWQSSSALADYRTSYRYDANGNILNLNRNGHNSVHLAMDSLSYHYISGTNQLAYVDDAVAVGNYSVDIDDQAVGNYAYDATGNLIKDVAEEIDSIVWTAYGKVLRVVRSSGSNKPDLHFAYGPDGNRLSKKAVYGNDSTVWTFYVRDAQGNTMATYKHKESSGVLHLTDHVLYGSSRLGSHERKHVELLGAGFSPITARAGIYGLERGDKRYELSNHLGNVLAVVSDRRAKASCADTLVRGYWADVVSTTDYYPFGMGMVERGDDGGYRYGFNGKEKDGEGMGGGGSTYDYGFRIYNPNLARFLSVDPLSPDYPYYTPYQFAGNTPVAAIDMDGLEEFIIVDYIGDDNKVQISIIMWVHPDDRIQGFDSDGNDLGNNYVQFQTRRYGTRSDVEPASGPSGDVLGVRNVSDVEPLSPEGQYLSAVWRKADDGSPITARNAMRSGEVVIVPGETQAMAYRGGSIELRFNLPINFVKDEDVFERNPILGADAQEYAVWLDRLSDFAKDNPNLNLIITGHTDVDGSVEDNLKLSERRSEKIKSELIDRGISGSRITTEGAGESQAKFGEEAPETDKVKDRRISVKFDLEQRQ